jgi:hypothetical protein
MCLETIALDIDSSSAAAVKLPNFATRVKIVIPVILSILAFVSF